MKGVLLGADSPIVSAGDVIDTAKALQEHLATLPSDRHQLEIAAIGIDQVLGDPRRLYRARRVAIMATLAIVARDYHTTCSEDEVLFDGLALTNVQLRADFSRFAFLRAPMIRSLTLQLFSAEIIGANEKPYIGSTITSGMHVPVMAVSSVFPLD